MHVVRRTIQTNRLKTLREDAGLKPHELAVELGVDPSTVYRWESTSAIPDRWKLRLSERFGVSVAVLMGWDAEEAA